MLRFNCVQRRQGFRAKEVVNVYKNWEMNDFVQGSTPRCLVTTNDDTYFLNVTLDQVLQVDCRSLSQPAANMRAMANVSMNYYYYIQVMQGLVGFPVSSRSVGFYSHLDAIVTIYGTERA
ncbi:Histidinol-phosphate aminotransferase [Trichinella pseudospiralis]